MPICDECGAEMIKGEKVRYYEPILRSEGGKRKRRLYVCPKCSLRRYFPCEEGD